MQCPRCILKTVHDIHAVLQLAFREPADQFPGSASGVSRHSKSESFTTSSGRPAIRHWWFNMGAIGYFPCFAFTRSITRRLISLASAMVSATIFGVVSIIFLPAGDS